MKELFKRLRKRHPSNDPSVSTLPLVFCGKLAILEDAVSHRIVQKGDVVAETNSNEEALLHAGPETSAERDHVMTRHLMEPTVLDHPIRCPHPEPCIIQDGRALKEKSLSIKRRGQLPFLTANELQKLRWNRRSSPSDVQIYPAASAPEHSLISNLS